MMLVHHQIDEPKEFAFGLEEPTEVERLLLEHQEQRGQVAQL
jgi:hypothetical protein